MIEEYKFCKEHILENIRWMDKLEVYVVGAVAAVYVFIFSQTGAILAEFLSLIPFTIVLLGALRTIAIDQTIRVLNNYIEDIETKNPEIGFTGYYRTSRSFAMKSSRYAVWGMLLVLTLFFQILALSKGPFWLR